MSSSSSPSPSHHPQVITLAPQVLNVVIGRPPPPHALLNSLATSSSASPAHQRILLSSRNLVQLCNFLRRLRSERTNGLRRHYLVLLEFLPHRETWDFLHRFREFQVTLVLFGGVCASYAIRELYETQRVDGAICEWFREQQCTGGVPVLCGAVSSHIGIIATTAIPIDYLMRGSESLIADWISERNPRAFTASSFHSMQQQHPQHQHPQQHQQQQQRRQHATAATATMSVREACVILGITEQDSHRRDTITKAYRRRAFLLHPDKQSRRRPNGDASSNNDNATTATSEFSRLNEARQFLDSLF